MKENFEPIDDQNKDQAIQVIIRIKPRTNQSSEEQLKKCVFLSPTQQNTIIVEIPNKKEYFSFDHIASEDCKQEQIFQKIGMPILTESWNGFNCCIFAYGQTGAGKTYSTLGNTTQILLDNYAQSRGILPRLMQSLFQKVQQQECKSYEVKCSYLQIYNQQIIDLLSKQIKTYQIREDFKKGVYVDGLSQNKINSYQQSIDYILKGLKNRKIASTSMNSQSSRSHTIFTILLKLDIEEQGVLVSRFSKVHIVDLAGSQRTKLAKVQGERLKQGCNINKSLHALGNVINSLVQSIKKKKYIPFRDSKLTFFLKDSLGGNSKTKLLANINPRKAYLGDTISTLMFAKRAKIIKSKVEVNENVGQSIQSLRNQIKRLRQQLAQNKFIKKPTIRKVGEQQKQLEIQQVEQIIENDQKQEKDEIIEPILEIKVDQVQKKQKILKVFEQNEINYKLIIQLYQQRIKEMPVRIQKFQNSKIKQLYQSKKKLQKQCSYYCSLISNFKPFSKIFNQNVQLKNKVKLLQKKQRELLDNSEQYEIQLENLKYRNKNLEKQIQQINLQNKQLLLLNEENQNIIQQLQNKWKNNQQINVVRTRNVSISVQREQSKQTIRKQNMIIDQYQGIIEQLKQKLKSYSNELKESYQELQKELQNEKKQKRQIRKQKRKQVTPSIQNLQDQNQYLKLNIMQLENLQKEQEENNFKKQIQIKLCNQQIQRLKFQLEKYQNNYNSIQQVQLFNIIQKLKQIQNNVQNQANLMEQEQLRQQQQYNNIKLQIKKLNSLNHDLIQKNDQLLLQNTNLKKKINEIIENQKQSMLGSTNKTSMIWSNQVCLQQQKSPNSYLINEINKLSNQNEQLSNKIKQIQNQHMQDRNRLQKYYNKHMTSSQKVINLQQQISFLQNQNEKLKQMMEKMRFNEQEINRKRHHLQKYEKLKQSISTEFGKQIKEIIQEYKLFIKRNQQLNLQNQRLRNQNLLLQKSKINELPITKSVRTLTLPIVKQYQMYATTRIKSEKSQQVKLNQTSRKEQDILKIQKKQSFNDSKSTQQKPKQLKKDEKQIKNWKKK